MLSESTIDQPGLLTKPLVIANHYITEHEARLWILGVQAVRDPAIRWREEEETSGHYHETDPCFWRGFCEAACTLRLKYNGSARASFPHFSMSAGRPWLDRFASWLGVQEQTRELSVEEPSRGRPRPGALRATVRRNGGETSDGGRTLSRGWTFAADGEAARRVAEALWDSSDIYHVQPVSIADDLRQVLSWTDPRLESAARVAHLVRRGLFGLG